MWRVCAVFVRAVAVIRKVLFNIFVDWPNVLARLVSRPIASGRHDGIMLL